MRNCQGKICRYKCRCNNRFNHTEEELSVYRQITHFWDGGIDYYTGSEMIKHMKMKKLNEKYKRIQKENVMAGLGRAGQGSTERPVRIGPQTYRFLDP